MLTQSWMNLEKKSRIFIIDTSAILSGKPINLDNAIMITTSSVSNELKPGGRDYQTLQFLIEKGLSINSPSQDSINKIKTISNETGDIDRLSEVDIDVLALALDINAENDKEAVILTDDYSIQNVAQVLNIKFESISQRGITKRFIWSRQCLGCGKNFKENLKTCPICGSATKKIVTGRTNIRKRGRDYR
jgi:UPF0271 protein